MGNRVTPNDCRDGKAVLSSYESGFSQLRSKSELVEADAYPVAKVLNRGWSIDANGCTGYTSKAQDAAKGALVARSKELVPLLLKICKTDYSEGTVDVSYIAGMNQIRTGAVLALQYLSVPTNVCLSTVSNQSTSGK
jgi:hypothetical protein